MKYRRVVLIFIGLMTILLLTSCSPWAVKNQAAQDQWLSLNSTTSIGQTFVADYAGLQSIELLLSPEGTADGVLTIHLREDSTSQVDISKAELALKQVDHQGFYRFDFSPITSSAGKYFYALLSTDSRGNVGVGTGPANAYQNGSAYQAHAPIDAQLTFGLEYDRSIFFMGILSELLRWAGYFIISILLFAIPGWAILSTLWKGWNELSFFVKISLAIGVSLAVYTLIMLFTYLVHIQLGRWYAWIPLLIGVLIILWHNRKILSKIRLTKGITPLRSRKIIDKRSSFWPDLFLIVVLVLVFFSRFWALRGLDQPMWNDSLHHSEITQLIIDHQGLFSSWLPYAPYQTFSMHFGFPLASALLVWVTNIGSGQAVLWMGQILNVFAALALYPVAVKITRSNRMAGVVAVLVAGLLSPMPAYYINWGRYAQLAGQIILLIAIWMIWDVVDSASDNKDPNKIFRLPWTKIIITAGVITGMILFEFRMIFIIATFVIALSISELIMHLRFNLRKWFYKLWSVFIIGVISIVIFLPWGLHLQHSNLINYADLTINATALHSLVQQDYQTWQNVRFYAPIGLTVLAMIGLLWSIIKKEWRTASLGLWVAGMASLYSLTLIHVPWTQYVQSFAVLISLYMPIGLFIGYLVGDLFSRVVNRNYFYVASFVVIIVLCLAGAWSQRNIANPATYGLVTRPDSRAMTWINENTPANSLFLVEGMHENWVTNIVGTDAGWWIPLLTKRSNTIPPQYALANEVPIQKDYSQKVVQLESTLEKTSPGSQAGMKLLCEYGITHVYIGQKQGGVGNSGEALFSVQDLDSNTDFHLIYHQDRVSIFSFEGKCGQ